MDIRIKEAESLVKYGGDVILEAFNTSFKKHVKTHHDYVTDVDKKIEKVIANKVRALFPEDSILGEENELIEGASSFLWVVDPLDGTNNFVKGIPQAGIQIALYEDMNIVFAAILNPFTYQLYTAHRGKGAYVEDMHSGDKIKLCVAENKLADSVLIYDSGIVKGLSPSREIFNAFMGTVGWVRIFGAAVLDLPFIAQGSADVLISNIPKPMDIAPGCLLIEEAGGIITDFRGEPWSLHSENILVGTNANHPEALAVIQGIIN